MNVRCPHCHNPIEVIDEVVLRDVECSSCGSRFSLVDDDITASYRTTTRKIAHFELLDQIGVGGFGTVWKARDPQLDRIVAIKIPRAGQLDGEDAELFLREARAAARLKHPNIVGVHEVGRDEGQLYIVTDYVDGANLKEWLSGKSMEPHAVARLCAKIADALDHAHQRGVVHRDVKPGNVMLDGEGEPYLVDFGLAKREVGEITMTVNGKVLGTPAYMSPEQAAGKSNEADRRSDVYSLGVILFELLTGELPFRGDTRMLLLRILRDEPPSLRKLNNAVPGDLETICLKCLRKEPEHRYPTAHELAADLHRWLSGEPIQARNVGAWRRMWMWVRRRFMVAPVLAKFDNERKMRLLQQENNRQRAATLVEALTLGPPAEVPNSAAQLSKLREHAVQLLGKKVGELPSDSQQRLHALCALAALTYVDPRRIVPLIGTANADECGNIVLALRKSREESLAVLASSSSAAQDTSDWALRSRLAIVALHLGESSAATDMLRVGDRPNPIQRTAFIETFATWHGDLAALAPIMASLDDRGLTSGILLAIATIPKLDESVKEAWRPIVSDWYLRHADAVTHSAAGLVLRRWNLVATELGSQEQPLDGMEWFVTKVGLTLIRIPSGPLVRQAEKETPPSSPKATVWLSDREVSVAQFLAFVNDKSYTGLKPEKWSGELRDYGSSPTHPVQFVSWFDAVLFCNWLSLKEGRTPCYEPVGGSDAAQTKIDIRTTPVAAICTPSWRLVEGASGYRLPTEAEWEFACRAGTKTIYSFGDDEQLLPRYAVFQASRPEPAASRLCNALGLFDMHGNVWEWCHDWYWDYPGARTVETDQSSSSQPRGIRGGGWGDPAGLCRVSDRIRLQPVNRSRAVGFRVLLVLAAK